MNKHTTIFLSLFLTLCPAFAHAFLPYVKNYTRDIYAAAGQNWTIQPDSANHIYIGNHNGLLEFDGCSWTLHALKSKNIVRSVFVSSDGTIYVGSNQEFGYFKRDIYGELIYTSLSENLDPALLHNKQIWSIVETGQTIYFQSFGGYFIYDGQTVTFSKAPFQLFMMYAINGKVYNASRQKLYLFNGRRFIDQKADYGKSQVKSMIAYDAGTMLLATESEGIWHYDGKTTRRWTTEIDNELKWVNPNRIFITRDSLLLIGTVLNGIYALDRKGTLVWHLNTTNGLQNNTILGITGDREGNIWLALDNGISVIYNTSHLKVNAWKSKNIGSVYDVGIHRDQLYMATNQGLFTTGTEILYSHRNDNPIHLVPDTEGFILDLHTTPDQQILIGHSKKTLITDHRNHLLQLSNRGGGMCAREVNSSTGPLLIQSTYTRFCVYERHPGTGQWHFRNDWKSFSNPIQFFEVSHNGVIWAAHSTKGLYKIKVDKDYADVISSHYYPAPGSLSDTQTGVFRLRDRIVFTDAERCYTYDDLNDTIVAYDYLNRHLGRFATAHRIVRVDDNRYWFITGRDAALVSLEEERPVICHTVTYADYGFTMLENFENIVPVSPEYSLLCYQNGLAQLFHVCEARENRFSAALTVVSARAYDTQGRQPSLPLEVQPTGRITLPYTRNSVHFRLAYPVYGESTDMTYRLRGLNDQWETTTNGQVEFTRLPAGSYTLEIAAINKKGETMSTLRYDFRIRPPFYASARAYVVYGILLLAILYAIYYFTRRKAIRESRKIQEQQEKEIIKLENEKLSNELTFKSKEMASSAMNLIRNAETLKALKNELEKQKEQLGTQYPNKYYNRMISLIEENLSSTQEWEVFQANFDRIHENFFRNLRKQYPELSAGDLKLCALLRLNLDNKEIANLMNITIRGVETRRYRLRQRLKLSSNENLTEFLIDFK